ncbi:POZ+kelch domain protein with kelch repeats at the C-terminus [Cryptosporidium ryanae]|uniref:POZ+kelch domain protein with kelch repeats at the C-terminus n=1 Tax=Cryptosporidium ryanae TaxID=515981 RepID=UPI00351A3232|nr:POZ+kelch domain protein with kelch repeats at the C-terminus [Cryptosporidium ryanae]
MQTIDRKDEDADLDIQNKLINISFSNESISSGILHGFELMTNEMREIFGEHIRRIEKKILSEFEKLEHERTCFEREKKSLFREIECIKRSEYERIKKLEKNIEEETLVTRKLLNREKKENFKQLLEEKEAFNKKQQEISNYWSNIENELKKEKLEIEELKEKINKISSSSKSTIEINVGGTKFEVSRKVLTEGKARGSILERIYSGKTFGIEIETDKDGNIFFDRDPDIFKNILNYLRDERKTIPQVFNIEASLNLLREMNYFGIKFFDNSLIYVFGGSNGDKIMDSAEVLILPSTLYDEKFSIDNNSNLCWSIVKSMITPRAFGSSSDINNSNCALFGGYNNMSKALETMEIYDPLTDSWRQGPSMSTRRRNLSSVTLDDGRIFAIGGFDGENIIGLTEFYDPRLKYWFSGPQLNVPRSSSSCVKLDQYTIAIIGGTRGDKRLKSIELFDIRRNLWEILDSIELLEARSGATAYSLHGKVCVWGGVDQNNNILDSGEFVNVAFYSKDNTLNYRNPMFQGITDARMSSITLNDYTALICGGQTKNETMSDSQIYVFQEDKWDKGPKLNFPRYGHSITRLDI